MPAAQLTIDVHLDAGDRAAALAADARNGLTSSPKAVSPIWFYDERGSGLFDEITGLPEYYLTRCERELLRAHASQIAKLACADTLVELGSGTSEKTRILLDAMTATGQLRRYVPLDVSEETIRAAAAELVGTYSSLDVHAVVGDFHRHLDYLPEGGRRLVAFLGSTMGNLRPSERARFLFDVDCMLSGDDRLLLGCDLVKDPARLLAAYDDPLGVTAEFNRNALLVMNRELEADFDPATFEHVALWHPAEAWMEMRLRATTAHTVRVSRLDLDVTFEAGEDLLTEISAKFTPAGIAQELERAGFVIEQTWQAGVDDFLLVLARSYC